MTMSLATRPKASLGGIGYAFVAYALFAIADASVKGVGPGLSAFESSFILTVASIAVVPFLKARDESWTGMLHMRRPVLTLARATASTLAGIFSVVALTRIPIAEAYSLIFLAPVIALILSVLVLSEAVGWRRWSSVAAGIAGVLIVTRPGFHALNIGHLSALAASLCVAASVIALRQLGPDERPSTIYAWLTIVSLAVNLALMLAYGWVAPTPLQWGLLVLCGVAAGGGQIFLMAATRVAPANQVAPLQYNQLGWAIVYGAVFFLELPDLPTIIGLLFVASSGLFLIQRKPKDAVPMPGTLT
ncbi:MAG TPA: DMT family transporter [Devosiaceae bacterium]|nr:DMT family transporter [Devosiaceae bacterium]